MRSARSGRFESVQWGLGVIGGALASTAVLSAVNRVVFSFLFRSLYTRSGATHAVTSLLSFLLRAAFLATAVGLAVGAARLGDLPPVERAVMKGAGYRASPSVGSDQRHATLARALGVAAWASVVVDVGGLLLDWAGGALRLAGPGSSHIYEVSWVLSLCAAAAVSILLALWIAAAAKDRGVRVPEPLPVLVIAMVTLRTAFIVVRGLADLKLPEWTAWTVTALWIAIDVALAVLAFGLARGLAALPDEPDAEPAAGSATAGQWMEAALGLERYAAALKARLVVMIGGVVLVLVAGLAGAKGGVQVVLVLLPVAAIVLGIVMMAGLARFARVPGDSRAGGPAVVALVLLAMASVADLYDLSLVSSLLGDSWSGKHDAMERMPYVETTAQVLALFGLLALLASFGRLATSMGELDLAGRARSLAVLMMILTSLAIVFRVATGGRSRGMEGVILMAPLLLVLGIVAISRYLRLIQDLRVAMAKRTG